LDALDPLLTPIRPIVDDGDGERGEWVCGPVVRRLALAKPAFVVGKLVGSSFEEVARNEIFGDFFVRCELSLTRFNFFFIGPPSSTTVHAT